MNRMRKLTSGEGPGRRTVGILEGKAVKAVHQSNKTRPKIIIPLLAEEGAKREPVRAKPEEKLR